MMRFVTIVFAALAWIAQPAVAQIKIEEVVSPSGIKALLVNEPAIPFVAFSFAFRGGTSLDPVDKVGATSFMASMLEEGTGDLDSRGFAEASEALAAKFRFSAGRDGVTVSAQVLNENRDEALDLLRRAITAPSFDPVPMERVRGQYLASIEQDMQSPGYLAGRRLSEMGFKGHPYANPVDGTLETIRAMTRDDLIAAKERVMTKDHVVVSAVGDITAEELGLVIDRMIGDLPDMGAPLPGKVTFGAPGGITIIDIPSPQSTAIWAQDTIGFGDPDFMVAYVMNHILGGGGFGSRLTTEVREKRGLTYGVYSYFAFLANANYLGGSVASANGTIAEALDVIRAEWQRMADEGVTPEELERAQKNLTGAYALRFDGNAEIAGILQSMQIDNFPTNYVNIRNDLVRAVTVEDVKRVAKRMLDTDALRFVVVGQPEGLTATE